MCSPLGRSYSSFSSFINLEITWFDVCLKFSEKKRSWTTTPLVKYLRVMHLGGQGLQDHTPELVPHTTRISLHRDLVTREMRGMLTLPPLLAQPFCGLLGFLMIF